MLELLTITMQATAPFTGPDGIWAHIVADFSNITDPAALQAFLMVLMIDVMLASDNAIVVGALAAGLPERQRHKVILIGVLAALVLRVLFALLATNLMQIVGLIFVGGLLLVWVAWKMWRELRESRSSDGVRDGEEHERSGMKPARSFAGAAWAVAVADVSMSLDNVLAVAGAAREHPGILIVGLMFAVALMGAAANIIATFIQHYRWIAYIGLAVILYVAVKMIHDGWVDPAVGIGTLFD